VEHRAVEEAHEVVFSSCVTKHLAKAKRDRRQAKKPAEASFWLG
jgi:hypothetical protein